MATYLYKIQPVRPEMLTGGSTEAEERIISDHFAYLEDLMGKGVLILAGRTLNKDYSSFGITIIKAESDEEARRVMHNDPAVKNHVMRAELYPYRIALLEAGNAQQD